MPEYYSAGPLLSRNATLNISVGGRGIGKTYDSKIRVLRAYRKNRAQFIYVRRYKNELATAKNSFLADLPPKLTENMFIRGSQLFYCLNPEAPKKQREYDIVGHFVALSTAGNQKSVAYPRVTTIIYDEFVLPPGGNVRYIPDEPRMFLEFFNTVDRFSGRVRALLLANAGTIMCPYFAAWHVIPNGHEYITAGHGFVCAQYVPKSAYGEWAETTEFGRFVREMDPEYAAYSIGNDFADGRQEFVESPPTDGRYLATVLTPAGALAFWRASEAHWWVTTKRPKQEKLYAFAPELMVEGAKFAGRNDWPIATARWAYNRGSLTFHDARARNLFISIY